MEILERAGLRKPEALKKTEPIVFPVRTEEKYEEFFKVLGEQKFVRYSWKFGRLIVRGCEPLLHEKFASILGRNIPTAIDLLKLLAVSGIEFRITEWKEYIGEERVKDLESLVGMFRARLPAPKEKVNLGLEGLLRFGKEYLSVRNKVEAISFPVISENAEYTEFFRILQNVRRVTYNWGDGKILLQDYSGFCNSPLIRTISHEDFLKAVGRKATTSAEILVLLALSKISFAVTNYDDFLSEETLNRLIGFTKMMTQSIGV